VTICFTDVVGSTAMAARLGDRQFAEIMDRHAEVVATLAGLHEGHVIKSQGDGFMLVFASVRRAVSFAEELQHRLSAASEADEEEALSVRVGLHTGEAERRGADLLGTAVIHAARLCARADSGQVLVSAVVRDLLEPEGAFSFEAPRLVTLKGLPGRYAASALKIESPDPHRGSRHRAVPARRS
jgi:class 3 adenylate cyclase